MIEEYTIKEYAELKGLNLRASTRNLLGKNAQRIEKNLPIKTERKYKHEKGSWKRGKKRKGVFIPHKKQPGVRVWPIEILKEIFVM